MQEKDFESAFHFSSHIYYAGWQKFMTGPLKVNLVDLRCI